MLGDQNDLPSAGSAGGRIILVRVGIAAAVLAALAILAGTAALAVSAASRPVRHSGHRGAARQRRPAGALRLLSVRPPAGARVSGDASVRFEFSAPLKPGTPLPRLSPRVTGRWQISGSTLTFTPDRPLPPSTRFRLRIPSGQSGLRSIGGGLLTRRVTTRFATAAYSQLRLAELLSSLGYLPLSWQPGVGGRLSGGPAGGESAQQELAYSPPAGSFSWQRGYPVALHGLWRPALASPLVRGAVMAFKAQHRLPSRCGVRGNLAPPRGPGSRAKGRFSGLHTGSAGTLILCLFLI